MVFYNLHRRLPARVARAAPHHLSERARPEHVSHLVPAVAPRLALRRVVRDEHVVDAYYQFLVLVVVSSVPRRFRGLRQLPARIEVRVVPEPGVAAPVRLRQEHGGARGDPGPAARGRPHLRGRGRARPRARRGRVSPLVFLEADERATGRARVVHGGVHPDRRVARVPRRALEMDKATPSRFRRACHGRARKWRSSSRDQECSSPRCWFGRDLSRNGEAPHVRSTKMCDWMHIRWNLEPTIRRKRRIPTPDDWPRGFAFSRVPNWRTKLRRTVSTRRAPRKGTPLRSYPGARGRER